MKTVLYHLGDVQVPFEIEYKVLKLLTLHLQVCSLNVAIILLIFKLLINLHNYFTELEDKDNNIKIPTTPNKVSGESDVVLRRTHSFETDEK